MFFSFSYSLFICLFIQNDVNKSSASHHLFLFTYANHFFIKCDFRFNIHYLFVYLCKAMSTTAAQVTTCFYLLMEIDCWLHVVFVLIFIIYLFIYSKRCQQKQVELTTFIYLWKSLVVRHGFHLNIHYLFIYLFKAMSTKAGGSDDLYLLMEMNCTYTWFSF